MNGVPVYVKDIGAVSVGYTPRLGITGKDHDDDVALSIVVMNRTLHTDDVVPLIKAEVDKMNTDGTLPPGVKIVPYYDRTNLVDVTTHTVLHNLIFGCLLVFLIQWIFLGDLRSAIIVGVNIPFALFFAIIVLVLRGEEANLLSLGAVDFGIIVNSAVILVENIFRNFQSPPDVRHQLLADLAEGVWGTDPTSPSRISTIKNWTDRLRLILISALQVDKAIFFSATITVAAFVPLFTMQGVEGQIFGPMARTYGYALAGALDRNLYGNAGSGVLPAARAYQRGRDHRGAGLESDLLACLEVFACKSPDHGRVRIDVPGGERSSRRRASAANFYLRSRKAISGSAPRCRRPWAWRPAPKPQVKCARFCCATRK